MAGNYIRLYGLASGHLFSHIDDFFRQKFTLNRKLTSFLIIRELFIDSLMLLGLFTFISVWLILFVKDFSLLRSQQRRIRQKNSWEPTGLRPKSPTTRLQSCQWVYVRRTEGVGQERHQVSWRRSWTIIIPEILKISRCPLAKECEVRDDQVHSHCLKVIGWLTGRWWDEH